MPANKTRKKAAAKAVIGSRQIAAGEFKAKCLGVMREVASTGTALRSPGLILTRRRAGVRFEIADDRRSRWLIARSINSLSSINSATTLSMSILYIA